MVSADPLELFVHDCYWPRVAERPHQTEPRGANATAEEQERQQRQGGVVSLSLLEDSRVSLTATHLLQGGGAVEPGGGGAFHPHYEVGFLQPLMSLRNAAAVAAPAVAAHNFSVAAPLYFRCGCAKYLVWQSQGWNEWLAFSPARGESLFALQDKQQFFEYKYIATPVF